MADAAVGVLAVTALTLGLVHTVVGPDHYVPFVALARAGGWGLRKTLLVAGLCGVGHVLSSVAIGLIGVAAGLALPTVTGVEEARAPIATWALIGFGLAYGTWGLWAALRGHRHSHLHSHDDRSVHEHEHSHGLDHMHPHGAGRAVWFMFIVFVLGPCEPLIPLLMYPAAAHHWVALALVTTVFGVATVGTMLAMTALGWAGFRLIRLGAMERFAHAMAGGVLALSGVIVMVLDV